MELHDNLYALGLRLGREVFDDPDSFRGALDDFLDENAASTGDINLLVDAVRLGAFRSMMTMLDSGAEVSRAVEEAGGRLARDRGSADVAGSQWACAVLGFAVGKVADADVRRYRTQTPPSTSSRPAAPPPAPTALPGTPVPAQPPPPQGQPQAPPPRPPAYTPPSYPAQQSWGNAGQQKRKTWPILVAVLAVLVVIGGVVTAVVISGGDDTPSAKRGTTSTTTSSTDPLDFKAINQRYTGLGTAVTTGVDTCEDAGAGSEETEKLSCSFSDGTLTLTTYDSADALERARTRDVDLGDSYGGMYLMTGPNIVYGFDATKNEDDSIDKSTLYWDDDHSFQTAELQASSSEVPLDDLKRIFKSTGSLLPYPTGPTDGGLIDFINRVSQSSRCMRIATLTIGETEENNCKAPKGISVYYGHWQQKSPMNSYRQSRAQNARTSGGKPDTWHLTSTPDVEIGKLDQYVLSEGTSDEQAVLYWDDASCLCYGEAYLPGSGQQDKLYNWWAGG